MATTVPRMASRQLCRPMIASSRISTSLPFHASRSFRTTSRLLETPSAALPVRKPIGAFRGGMFGFLLGSTLTGAGVYYYILEEYKVSNELLTEDIYALQAAVQRIHSYVTALEEKVDTMQKKK